MEGDQQIDIFQQRASVNRNSFNKKDKKCKESKSMKLETEMIQD